MKASLIMAILLAAMPETQVLKLRAMTHTKTKNYAIEAAHNLEKAKESFDFDEFAE